MSEMSHSEKGMGTTDEISRSEEGKVSKPPDVEDREDREDNFFLNASISISILLLPAS